MTFICEICSGLGILKATLYHGWMNPPICPSCNGTGKKTSYDEAAQLLGEHLGKMEKNHETTRKISDLHENCASQEHKSSGLIRRMIAITDVEICEVSTPKLENECGRMQNNETGTTTVETITLTKSDFELNQAHWLCKANAHLRIVVMYADGSSSIFGGPKSDNKSS